MQLWARCLLTPHLTPLPLPPALAVAADAEVLSRYAQLAAACAPQDAAGLARQLPGAAGKLSAAELDALENASIGGMGG